MSNETRRILVADDDPAIRTSLQDFLVDEGFDVSTALDGEQVLNAVEQSSPNLVLMDVRMPKLDGIDVLKRMKRSSAHVPVIVMTAFGGSNLTIEAIKLGAYDYVTKPFDLDTLQATITKFFEDEASRSDERNLQSEKPHVDPSDRIIGNSSAMQDVYKAIGRVAGSDAIVMVTGETGTGKELVAQTLHMNSSFSAGPLVKVNCAALPETLLESELFGHEKGSFTGAINQRKGRFELANKGTIFLDEIGEMTLGTQKKLLRVLQEREFERVGGTTTVRVEARVIAATNKKLEDEVANGKFREDLYYRLNVIHIGLPPLRERKEDIPDLVSYFLQKHRYTPDAAPANISREALRLLHEHDWPGNVRELENTIERAVILARGGVITSNHLVFNQIRSGRILDLSDLIGRTTSLDIALQEVEGRLLFEALALKNGDRDEAARLLGINRSLLDSKLRTADVREATPV